jgi:hypothetical protein
MRAGAAVSVIRKSEQAIGDRQPATGNDQIFAARRRAFESAI